MVRRFGRKRAGEIAEMGFQFRASLRGLRVAKPFGDSFPYDFITDNGWNRWLVQVKSTFFRRACGSYAIKCQKGTGLKSRRYRSREVDFLAFYIFPVDAWYIMPLKALGKSRSVVFYPDGDGTKGKYEQYREAWHLLTERG